jgi:hypothetical protein
MRRERVGVVGAVVAVVALTVWVSSSEEVWFARGEARQADIDRRADPVQQEPADEVLERPSDEPVGDDGWFAAVGTALLLVLALLLIALMVRREVRRRRRRRRRLREASGTRAGPSDLAEAQVVATTLLAATGDLTQTLRSGEPRNAIVACWVALEDVCAGIGLVRVASETSMEFTTRVVATYSVADEPIDALAALYREARFSEHLLTEEHRDRAVDALTALTAQLRRQASVAGSSTG